MRALGASSSGEGKRGMKIAETRGQRRQKFWRISAVGALVAILASAGTLASRSKPNRRFKYVGGTESLLRDCSGDLELKNDALTFRCPGGTKTIPYASIEFMEYRPSPSAKVRKLGLQWEVPPPGAVPIISKKQNRFFAVIYSEAGNPQGLILEVSPNIMQPYIAEIELKSRKRVEVYSHEDYY
jgi:hypothetical protein